MICHYSKNHRLVYEIPREFVCPGVRDEDVKNAEETVYAVYRERISEVKTRAHLCSKKSTAGTTFQNFIGIHIFNLTIYS